MSNGEKFKKGDVVRLKSGGPHMAVDSYEGRGESRVVYCKWFDEQKLTDGVFEEATLELVEKDDAPPAIMTG